MEIKRILYVFTLCGLLALPFHAQAWSFKKFARPFIAKADKIACKAYVFMKKHPFITLGCITSFIGAYKAWQAKPSLWTWFFAKQNDLKTTKNEQPIKEEKVSVKEIKPKVEEVQKPAVQQKKDTPSISNNNTTERKDNNNNSTREIRVTQQTSTSNQPDDIDELNKLFAANAQRELKDTFWGKAHTLNEEIQQEMPELIYLKSAQDQNENEDNNACGLYTLAEIIGLYNYLEQNTNEKNRKSRTQISTEYLANLQKQYPQYIRKQLTPNDLQKILDKYQMHKTPIVSINNGRISDAFGQDDFDSIVDFKPNPTSTGFWPIIINYGEHWSFCALAKESNQPIQLLYVNSTNAQLTKESNTYKNLQTLYTTIHNCGVFKPLEYNYV